MSSSSKPGLSRSSPSPSISNSPHLGDANKTPPSASPITRQASGIFSNHLSFDSPQNSPQHSSLLASSSHELSDSADSFSNEGHSQPLCNFVSGVKVKVAAEYGRNDHTAVLYEDNMYIYGGVNVDNTLPTSIHVFNIASRSFSVVTPATNPPPRYQHSAVLCDNQCIVFGGGTETGLLNDLHVFSFDTQTWSTLEPSTAVRPPARRGHSAVLVSTPATATTPAKPKAMYVFGGFGDNGPFNDLYKFDLEQKYWKLVNAKGILPQARFLHSTCVYKNSICLFGGTNIDFVFGDMFMFNCDTNTWTEIVVDLPHPSPRCSHAAMQIQDSLLVIGGATDQDSLDVHEFHFDTKKWTEIALTNPGISRQGHSAVLRGESVFLFGGAAGANHNQLDLLCLGTKYEFEDEFLQESAQDEEIARIQALPRTVWEAILLRKHPEILQYRELTRTLSKAHSYARMRPCATTEDPAHLNHQLVVQLIVEYLLSQGCPRAANAIVEESNVPYFPLAAQPTFESRLVTILKVLQSRAKPNKNIFEFTVNSSYVPDQVDPELELVDHMAGAGRVDAQMYEEDVDIWAEPEDSRSNIVRTKDDAGKTVIRAANLNKLVQVLTFDREKVPDAVYLKTFFYTYRSFTSPEILLKKLIQKYHIRPEKGTIVDERYRTQVIEPVQTRVCRVLKFWIEQCPWDFSGYSSEKLVNSLNAFIDGPLSRDGNFTLVKQLRNSITKSQKKKPTAEDEKTITAGFNPPEPKVPRNLFSHSLELKHIDELELARQLTLIEFRSFASITPPEFLNKGWMDSNPNKSMHIKELRTRGEDTARWVALQILESDGKRARAKVLEKFIRVADQLRQIKNFQTTASVTVGFCHPSIHRLGQTFGEISPRAKELYQELVLFAKDDKAYRDIIRNAPLPCIPNMEVALVDLASLQDTTPDYLNKLIHFQKRIQIYHHITKLQGFQQRQFNLLHVHQIAHLLTDIPKTTDKDLDDLSRKCE